MFASECEPWKLRDESGEDFQVAYFWISP
jgi:hypothetical protein